MAITENEVAFAALKICAAQPNGVASFRRLKREIPDIVALTAADLRQSVTRPREPMWHQKIRNIRSHHDAEGNYINEGYLESVPSVGYRITDAGRKHLKGGL